MSQQIVNQLLGINGQKQQLRIPISFAQDDDGNETTDDNNPTDDDVNPPQPEPKPTDDDNGDKDSDKHASKAHIYIYMGSVVLLLSLLYLCMFCCVRRKNMKGKKKPIKDELVQQNNENRTVQQPVENAQQMNLQLTEMP